MIVVVTSELPPAGGVGEIAGQIIDSARRSSVAIQLITDSGVTSTADLKDVGSRSFFKSIGMAKELFRALINPVVEKIILVDTRAIYFFGFLTLLAPHAIENRHKVVCILHGSELERFVLRPSFRRKIAWYPSFILRSVTHAHITHCVSDFLRRKWEITWCLALSKAWLGRGLVRPNFRVLDLPLPDYFTTAVHDPSLTSDQLKCHTVIKGGAYILSVGRLDPGKGMLAMASLMLEVLSRDSQLSWVIAGKGKLLSELNDMIARQPNEIARRVLSLGHINRASLPSLYGSAECFLGLSELPEGLGLSWVEALSMGTPVIARPVGALKQIVDSRNGILTRDDAEVVRAILGHFWESINPEECKASVSRWTGADGMCELLRIPSC